MSTQWRTAFEARAQAYWTDRRLDELLRGKDLPITPRTAPALLRAVGLLRRDAEMPAAEQRKFFQLNHMLRVIRPPLEELADGRKLHIVDAGCGRSYLTLSIAWWFVAMYGPGSVDVLGVDRRVKVLEDCARRTELAGLDDVVRFRAATIDAVDLDEVDVVIALHACDTATDDAIRVGLRHEARMIAVAPCCHAELAAKWASRDEDHPFAEVWRTPHLRREVGASMTDAFRKLLLQAAGYETRAVEFVASEHTPKNTLIRAIKRTPGDDAALQRYRALRAHTGGVGIDLERSLGV